jgi:hypothetical protein
LQLSKRTSQTQQNQQKSKEIRQNTSRDERFSKSDGPDVNSMAAKQMNQY